MAQYKLLNLGRREVVHNGLSMVLVSEDCWRHITNAYGLIGPEILFFCHEDPITNKFMPDLEPSKLSVTYLSSQDTSHQMTMLISPHLSGY